MMTDEPFLFYGLVMGSAGCAAFSVYPIIVRFSGKAARRLAKYQLLKVTNATKELDEIFLDVKPKWLKVAYGVGPILAGLVTWLLSRNTILAMAGAVVGIALPDLWVRNQKAMRKKKFQSQLVDALFILSSSLRAGLSLAQAFEQLASEMSPPASEEFGLVIKAHRLGRTLEHALEGLNDRMQLEDLQLVTTAILLARETGGDVTYIINQLITTIRERKKLFDKVNTLTVQGRFQAYIMSLLPVLFAMFVKSFNPGYFNEMLQNQTGQMLLALAVGLWLIGVFLLIVLSRVEF